MAYGVCWKKKSRIGLSLASNSLTLIKLSQKVRITFENARLEVNKMDLLCWVKGILKREILFKIHQSTV